MQNFSTTSISSMIAVILVGISIYYIFNILKWSGVVHRKFIYIIIIPFSGLFMYAIITTSFSFLPLALSTWMLNFSGYIILGWTISFHLLIENFARNWVNNSSNK